MLSKFADKSAQKSSIFTTKASFERSLITGASSGIGEAFSKLLAKNKISMIIVARDLAKLESLAKELKNFVPVKIICADLCTKDGCNLVVDTIKNQVPDLVVNCAGFGLYGEATLFPTDENLKMIDLNIRALTEITLEASKTLISQKKKGTILNISSVSDLMIFPGFAIYAATKAFVTQFSQSLDIEMKDQGVRVLTASPGVVRTDFRRRASGRVDIPSGTFSMDVDFAARELWKQLVKGKSLNYFDLKTKIIRFIALHLIPSKLLSKILYKIILSYRHLPKS